MKKLQKKGLKILNVFSSSDLDTYKDEITEELKNANFNNLEDMVLV